MNQEQTFFVCKHCGNFVGMIFNAGVKMICCGENMVKLEPNTVEASTEKHLPVVKVDGNKVTVQIGSELHPMIDAHKIDFIYIETEKGGQRKNLVANNSPIAEFYLQDDKLVSAYAYCNLHGLWKA